MTTGLKQQALRLTSYPLKTWRDLQKFPDHQVFLCSDPDLIAMHRLDGPFYCWDVHWTGQGTVGIHHGAIGRVFVQKEDTTVLRYLKPVKRIGGTSMHEGQGDLKSYALSATRVKLTAVQGRGIENYNVDYYTGLFLGTLALDHSELPSRMRGNTADQQERPWVAIPRYSVGKGHWFKTKKEGISFLLRHSGLAEGKDFDPKQAARKLIPELPVRVEKLEPDSDFELVSDLNGEVLGLVVYDSQEDAPPEAHPNWKHLQYYAQPAHAMYEIEYFKTRYEAMKYLLSPKRRN